jgi:hypothetical protein
MTDEEYKQCTVKIKALADVKKMGLDDTDAIIRSFHKMVTAESPRPAKGANGTNGAVKEALDLDGSANGDSSVQAEVVPPQNKESNVHAEVVPPPNEESNSHAEVVSPPNGESNVHAEVVSPPNGESNGHDEVVSPLNGKSNGHAEVVPPPTEQMKEFLATEKA